MKKFSIFLILTFLFPVLGFSQTVPGGLEALTITESANGDKTYSLSLKILALMTALTILPSLVLGMTAFTRIVIVMSILRQALGTQQTPPNQIIIAISLFLTFFVMAPTFNKIYSTVSGPYQAGEMNLSEAIESGGNELKGFMIKNTRKNDLVMFSDMANKGDFLDTSEIPFYIILPAYMTSELKTAFQIGFLLFLPFLVIDMVIASILMSLGMMMLSPMLIALPFKLLLFVLVDGWYDSWFISWNLFTLERSLFMGFDENIEMVRLAFYQVLITSGPFLGAALAIGLLIGILQAATSIQEMTLSFVPKMVLVIFAMGFLAPFLLVSLHDYFNFIFETVSGLK